MDIVKSDKLVLIILLLLFQLCSSSYAGPGTFFSGGGDGSDTNSVKEYYWMGESTIPKKPVTVPTSGTADGIASISSDTGTNSDILGAAFDDTADEYTMVKFKVPSDVDTSGTVTFRIRGYAATAAAQDIAMLVAWHEVGDAEDWDGALTEETGTTTLTNTQDALDTLVITETVSTLGWVANDEVFLYIGRDGDHATNDGLSGDFIMTGFSVEIPRT